MSPLSLNAILLHLAEAHEELRRLFARMHFAIFGEVDDESVKDLEAFVAQEESRNPLTEETVFSAMARAYRHLNIGWNGRHASEECVRQCAPADLKRWLKFPRGAIFCDLWPAPSRCRGTPREPGRGRIEPNSLQAAFLQMAVRKLGSLRYIISFSLGDKRVPRPKGLRPGIETEPFTEEAFARRMHRIYREMNTAWSYRRKMRSEKLTRQTIRRRAQFPRVFLSAIVSSAAPSRAKYKGWITRSQLQEVERRIWKYHAQWES